MKTWFLNHHFLYFSPQKPILFHTWIPLHFIIFLLSFLLFSTKKNSPLFGSWRTVEEGSLEATDFPPTAKNDKIHIYLYQLKTFFNSKILIKVLNFMCDTKGEWHIIKVSNRRKVEEFPSKISFEISDEISFIVKA